MYNYKAFTIKKIEKQGIFYLSIFVYLQGEQGEQKISIKGDVSKWLFDLRIFYYCWITYGSMKSNHRSLHLDMSF